MKKIISMFMSCILIMAISITAIAAGPAEIMSYEEAYEIATIVTDNLTYDEETQKFVFDAEAAIEQGLDADIAYQLESSYAEMSVDESAKLKDSMGDGVEPRGLLAVAAGLLVTAGLDWLADKLLDWGAEKFCDNYGDYNSVTVGVCDFLGF